MLKRHHTTIIQFSIHTILLFSLAGRLLAVEYRAIDGAGNNVDHPDWGQAGTSLIRLGDLPIGVSPGSLSPTYDDGFNAPRSSNSVGEQLPNPRDISNVVSAQGDQSIANQYRATDWLWQWGQFIDHDFSLSAASASSGSLLIPVQPVDVATGQPDPLFSTTMPFIPFNRSDAAPGTGVGSDQARQQVNAISAFIDGSVVYGSDTARADFLRTHDGTGRMKTTTAANGEVLLPMNRAVNPLPNANPPVIPGQTPPPPESTFLAGDVRANEQVGLTAVHTLFVREHNRQVQRLTDTYSQTELEQRAAAAGLFDAQDSPDVGEYLYQSSRKIVGAELQAITYNEFLPMLLGEHALPTYTGYDPSVNSGIANEFATAAYRVGHTMLSPNLQQVAQDGTHLDPLTLRESFFNPAFVIDNGVDGILYGLTTQLAQNVDPMLIDDVRSFLFADNNGGLDLAAVNIQRGRDHGLPTLNDARQGLGLTRYVAFDQLSSNADVVDRLSSIYESVDDIDLWVGALVEDEYNGGMVGEVFHVIIADQFQRLRDGDRFFYLDDPYLNDLAPDVGEVTLADLLLLNTSITSMHDNVFLMSVPEPSAWQLGLLGILLLCSPVGRRVRRKTRS